MLADDKEGLPRGYAAQEIPRAKVATSRSGLSTRSSNPRIMTESGLFL
jgi:hypothetical protein